MGQCASSPIGGRSFSRESSWRSLFRGGGWSNSSRGNISATFNMMDVDLKMDLLLNVNVATEEELMTLPGITRTIARNIVDYRQAIGGFKKVEDLALVSGVGAAKLDHIRPEICVRRKNLSRSSSQTQSVDSLPSGSTESEHRNMRSSPLKVVNVNKANAFELMSIHGINQELAANIVDYRNRKGLFQKLEDLVKVRGMNHWSVNALRRYLTLEDLTVASNSSHSGLTFPVRTPQKMAGLGILANGKIPGLHGTKSSLMKCDSALSTTSQDTKDIFEMLSARTERPIVEEVFADDRNGRSALRIASWNLQAFSADKADNAGVREVVCRTILENRLSVLAVQEIVDKVAVEKICDELNKPILRRIQEWEGSRGSWVSFVSSPKQPSDQVVNSVGFLYDSSRGLRLQKFTTIDLAEGHKGGFTTEPMLGQFTVEQLHFSALNLHLCLPPNSDKEDKFVSAIAEVLNSHLHKDNHTVLLGDFSAAFQNKGVEQLLSGSYRNLVPTSSSTTSASSSSQGSKVHDNIWLSPTADSSFTGHWGIIRQGLSHLAIPNGWSWGGVVSQHCPIWCELYTDGTPVQVQMSNGGVHSVEAMGEV